MKILFLDQSGVPGGAELCLLDIAKPYRDRCLVGLFGNGSFKTMLEQQQIPVKVLSAKPITVWKESSWITGVFSFLQLIPLIGTVFRLSLQFDVIYANTPKALVVGAIASIFSRRLLIYHLHDILSNEHFSPANRWVLIFLSNHFVASIIANSQATKDAFMKAGGRSDRVQVIYNGFEPSNYSRKNNISPLKQQFGLNGQFLIGHFSRLAPWKGQHVLLEALSQCPSDIAAVFIGDALFGEYAYVKQLQEQVKALGLQDRVHFLGFHSEIASLMQDCDLIAHTSITAEPFGRVIVEAMLCGKPVVASQGGGVLELIEPDVTGWLVPPNQPQQLAATIAHCRNHPEITTAIAQKAQEVAKQKFQIDHTNRQTADLLQEIIKTQPKPSKKSLLEYK